MPCRRPLSVWGSFSQRSSVSGRWKAKMVREAGEDPHDPGRSSPCPTKRIRTGPALPRARDALAHPRCSGRPGRRSPTASSLRLRLNDAAELAADEESVVNRTGAGLKLPDGDAEPRAEVHLGLRIARPSRSRRAAGRSATWLGLLVGKRTRSCRQLTQRCQPREGACPFTPALISVRSSCSGAGTRGAGIRHGSSPRDAQDA